MAAKKTGVGKKGATPVKKNTAKKKTSERVIESNRRNAQVKSSDDKRLKYKLSVNQVVALPDKKSDSFTKEGKQLTIKEEKFINEYIQTGNARQSAIAAGYKYCSDDASWASQVGNRLLNKEYIKNEIKARMDAAKTEGIMSREEQLQFLSDMARGKILDQFDMPATNSDKIKALVELAKRTVDIEDRLKEKQQATAPEIKISLRWEGGPDGKKE